MITKKRRVESVGSDVLSDTAEVHMRLNAKDVREIGTVVELAVLCEQFGNVVSGPFVTVGPRDGSFVTCQSCLEAMHA